ncbi:MAG: Unknown protein [uncultured Sulfurovum sp.]|uniref:Uncharacterized protein n=1 Tax=uncultured Sulfurovum sp. TaxID=269237 RepID=A0A6S6T8H5_9BACT|nr:MAG: Unknown protein [uncultured Sulfurovum sp.]
MIKDILDGTKEVAGELSRGMIESCKEISIKSNILFADIEVKLMGSYEEIEAYEKAKASNVVNETEK